MTHQGGSTIPYAVGNCDLYVDNGVCFGVRVCYESSEDETIPEETFRRTMKKRRFVYSSLGVLGIEWLSDWWFFGFYSLT